MQVIGCSKPKGEVKANLGRSFGRNPGDYYLLCPVVISKSIHVGTRKMVNYAWPG